VGVGIKEQSMPKNGSNTADKLRNPASNNVAGSASEVPVNGRFDGSKFDSTRAFKEATKLIKRGVLSPSRFALERWVINKFGVKPKRAEVEAWQAQLQHRGVIEPYTATNGKSSYRLRVITTEG
jgi:hypothetical protein